MKTTIKKIKVLSILFLLAFGKLSTAQTLSFSINPNNYTVCSTAGLYCTLTSTVAGAGYYTFVLSSGASISYIGWSGPNATVSASFSSPGVYTLTALAYASTSSSIVLASSSQTITSIASPTITISGPSTACPNVPVTLTASGAASYTWAIMAPTFSLIPGPVLTYTPTTANMTYQVNAYGANGCFASTQNLSLTIGTSTVSVSQNTICAGGSATLSATGSTAYVWQPGNISGSVAVVSPSVGTSYSLISTNSLCTTTSTYYIAVAQYPNLSVPGPTSACLGSSAGLFVTGGTFYSWAPGNLTGAYVQVSPTVNTCYTVTATNVPNCSTSSVVCVTVNSAPTLTVTGPTNFCSGSTQVFNVSGTGATYNWLATNNNSVTGTTATFTPVMNNLTVTAIGANGCITNTSYPITYLPSPNINVSSNSAFTGTYVCEGSTLVYNATGANTYTWSTGVNTSSIAVIAGTYANPTPMGFTVSGTNASGCVSQTNINLWQYTHTCSIVWPGDANRDGVANSTDVLELGLQAGATGVTRSGASTSWTGQYVINWAGTGSTGWNKSHADCNGDGVINSSDNGAITANFNLTHAFKESSQTAASGDIRLVPAQNQAYEGIWNKVDIYLGDASNNMSQLYGLAFDINFDQNMVQTDSVKIMYTNSFLSNGNQNITFQKPIHSNGKLYAASVRVDHTNISGNGKIGEFWYKVKSGLPANSNLNLSISNTQKVNASAAFAPLSVEAPIVLNISNNLTDLSANGNLDRIVSVFPNPVQDKLILRSDVSTPVSYQLVDITGRQILNGEFNINATLDLSSLESGVYLIRFESGKNQFIQKIVVEK